MTGTQFPPYIFDEEFEALLKKNTTHLTSIAVPGTSKEDITVRAVRQSKVQYVRNTLNSICNTDQFLTTTEKVEQVKLQLGYSQELAEEAVAMY